MLDLPQADQATPREPEEEPAEALLSPLDDCQGPRAAEARVNEQRVVAKPSHRACLGDKRSRVRIPPTRSRCGSSSAAEHGPSKAEVASASLVSRFLPEKFNELNAAPVRRR